MLSLHKLISSKPRRMCSSWQQVIWPRLLVRESAHMHIESEFDTAYIDNAFVDRADVTEYIDYPPPSAVYEILKSSLMELIKRRVVADVVCIILYKCADCP